MRGRAARQFFDDLLTMRRQGAIGGQRDETGRSPARLRRHVIPVSVERFLDRPVKAPCPRVAHHLRSWAGLEVTPRTTSPSFCNAIKEPLCQAGGEQPCPVDAIDDPSAAGRAQPFAKFLAKEAIARVGFCQRVEHGFLGRTVRFRNRTAVGSWPQTKRHSGSTTEESSRPRDQPGGMQA